MSTTNALSQALDKVIRFFDNKFSEIRGDIKAVKEELKTLSIKFDRHVSLLRGVVLSIYSLIAIIMTLFGLMNVFPKYKKRWDAFVQAL